MAAATKWRNWRFGALLFCTIILVVNGYEEANRISQLSPKSTFHDGRLGGAGALQASRAEDLAFSIEPSAIYHEDRHLYRLDTSADPTEGLSDTEYEHRSIDTEEEAREHYVVVRSAEPREGVRGSRSIRTQAHNELDDLLHHKRKYYDIHPSKTRDFEGPPGASGDRLDFTWAGEGLRAPRGRALASGARLSPSAVQPTYATRPVDTPRQNSEIQNIITGIVKLLNGNVNVQANTQLLRPGRPLATRINNRGPPRISDVPIDPDTPMPAHSFVPTKTPPPYPFDRPPVLVPLPEQMVPPLGPPARPLHRPLPPWQRPRPPRPHRRPTPAIPMYKPQIIPYDIPEVNDEDRPGEVTANENETVHSENVIHHDELSFKPEPEPVTDAEPEEPTTELTIAEASTTTENTTTTEATATTTTTEKPKTEKPVKIEKKKETPVIEKDKPKDKVEKTTQPPKPDPTTNKPKPVQLTTEHVEEDEDKTHEVNKTENAVREVEPPQVEEVKPQNEIVSGMLNQSSVPALQSSLPEQVVLQPSPVEGSGLQTSQTSVAGALAPSASPTAPLPAVSAPATTPTKYGVAVPVTDDVDSQPLPPVPGGGGDGGGVPYQPYRPRPGIVLDDPEFKPHGAGGRIPAAPGPPVLTAARPPFNYGEIFDVTVSAIQGPGGKSPAVEIERVNVPDDDSEGLILTAGAGGGAEAGFVSIDGKRTYLNLFEQSTQSAPPPRPAHVAPTPVHAHAHNTGVSRPPDRRPPASAGPPRRPPPQGGSLPPYRRPQPTIRIDTCIVGDESTCDRAQHERCRTEAGISSCACRSGYGRRGRGRGGAVAAPCRRVVALQLALRVDRLYDRKVAWDATLADKESEPYQQLSFEAVRAMESAFSMTPFSDDFVGSSVTSLARGEDQRAVFVNATVLMQETAETVVPSVGVEIQKHLLGVLRRRSNNVGASALYVDSPHGAVLPLQDVDECASAELNDCHPQATCTNVWGGFRCRCAEGTLDGAGGGAGGEEGRACRSCPESACSGRGACRYRDGLPVCQCSGGYYGARCEVDGSVVGAALGASLAAAAVIALTLAALLSWSRRWSRAGGAGSPVFKYAGAAVKSPPVGHPPYQVTLEERMRWAQIAEAMVASHYAGEQQTMCTRPSSAMFGVYPSPHAPAPAPPVPLPRMGTLHGTLSTAGAGRARGAPGAHHTLYGYSGGGSGGGGPLASESLSSEASSHAHDLLVPRPKSRARSVHNQTGIYYDVEYENAEPLYGTAGPPAGKGIPLSTYTLSRGPPFYR